MATVAWTDSTVEFAGWKLHLSRAGTGRPALVLHHDIGTLDRLPFYDALYRLTNMVDAAGTTTNSYASNGQLATEKGPWTSDTVTLSYNSAGLRSSLSIAQPTSPGTQDACARRILSPLARRAFPLGEQT